VAERVLEGRLGIASVLICSIFFCTYLFVILTTFECGALAEFLWILYHLYFLFYFVLLLLPPLMTV
jgi:hypothetical protein